MKQYLDDYEKFEKVAKEWTNKSNEGYGKIKFGDHRVTSIQTLLLTPALIKYECAFYCRQVSDITWEVTAYFIPDTAIYKKSEKYNTETSKQTKLTALSFDFSDSLTQSDHEARVSINIPEKHMSKDECWSISPVNNMTIKKEECCYDPRKDSPPKCVIKLEWKRTDAKPIRFLEKFKLLGVSDPNLCTIDVCMDPSVIQCKPDSEILTLQSILPRLNDLASNWMTIGCNLNIPKGKLNAIEKDERKVEDCLREMLSVWLNITSLPSRELLSKAIESIDPNKAAELIKHIRAKPSALSQYRSHC